MKKTLAALALGAIIIPTAVIASGPHGDHRADKRIEHMSEQLQLSDQQRAEIQGIFEEQQAQHRAQREQMRERIGNVLTAEQKEKWARQRAGRKGSQCERNGKGHGHGGMG